VSATRNLTGVFAFVCTFLLLCGAYLAGRGCGPKLPPVNEEQRVRDAEWKRALDERDKQIVACQKRGGTPVMGFGLTAVCVQEKTE
jgi:hypothetical protein